MIAQYTDAQIDQEIATEECYLDELHKERKRRLKSRSLRLQPIEERIITAMRNGTVRRREMSYALVGVSNATMDMHLRRLREDGKIRQVGHGVYEICGGGK